ncbi:MAG: peptidase S53, partial [Acidobacteriia bacterium]|nr:peptidase S53 [Terriglobia bacterium]
MKHFSAVMAGCVAALCLFELSLSAQATLELEHVRPTNRINGRIDNDARVTLMGSRHALARPENDAGRLSADTRLERIQFALRPDESQQQALEALLAAQQDPDSPYYQQWLTPEEFGARFGISDNDLRTVVSWLEGKGFAVEPVPTGRRVVVFSGTAGQVESAFHTEMHTYQVNGRLHHANATDLEIPAALAPVTNGLVSLHDFHTTPLHAAPSGRPVG